MNRTRRQISSPSASLVAPPRTWLRALAVASVRDDCFRDDCAHAWVAEP